MMPSIRRSLVLGTICVVLAALAVSGVLVYTGVRRALMAQFDEAMEEKARLVASTVELTPVGVELNFDQIDMNEFERPEEAGYLRIWTPDGGVLYATPGFPVGDLGEFRDASEPLWIDLAGGVTVRGVGFRFFPKLDLDDEDDEKAGSGQPVEGEDEEAGDLEEGEDEAAGNGPVRSEGTDAVTEPGPDDTVAVTLVMARGTTRVDRFLARLKILLVSIGALAAVASALLLWTVIRRSLTPLSSLAAQIATIGDGNLASRVVLQRNPEEIRPIVERLNDLLRRIEAAFQRERSFSADVAHELRTPLAGLRATLEVAVSRPRTGDEYRQALSESLHMIEQLQGLIEKLLYLGRLEAGQLQVEAKPVDLADLVRVSWRPLAERAAQRGLQEEWSLPQRACVLSDASLLAAAVRNILENAVVHADEGGRINVSVSTSGGRTDLRVANTGSNVPQDQVPALFDRFVRGDSSRRSTGAHCGLGLTLIKGMTGLLGHDLTVESKIGGEFEVTLSLPAERSHAAA